MACSENNSDYTDEFNSFIITNIVLTVLFLIGLYLQIKIIIISKQEKDVTWRIDIYHSVVMISLYSFRILFNVITYIIPSMHQYTGKWLCYLALFLNLFGIASVLSHSLVISIFKYVNIVHHDVISGIGVDKASLITLWIHFFFSATWAVTFLARPNFPAISTISHCLGQQLENSTKANEAFTDRLHRFFFCDFDANDDQHYGVFSHIMNITNLTGCFITSVVTVVIMANIIEIFLYQRIFAFMKR